MKVPGRDFHRVPADFLAYLATDLSLLPSLRAGEWRLLNRIDGFSGEDYRR